MELIRLIIWIVSYLLFLLIGAFLSYLLIISILKSKEKLKDMVGDFELGDNIESCKIGEIYLSSKQFDSIQLLDKLIQRFGKETLIEYLGIEKNKKLVGGYAG